MRPGARAPDVFVCTGGGGVGKTTASAALALALARRGRTTLIVTVDPARRLAQALGVEIGPEVHAMTVPHEEASGLFGLMPEPRRSLRTFVDLLYAHDPAGKERLLANRVWATMGDALAGVHELASLMLVAGAVEARAYDALVIDTAPSRYALDFVAYPGRLAGLLEGRAMSFFADLASRSAPGSIPPPSKSRLALVEWGKKSVDALLARVLGPNIVRDLTGLFSELLPVRERFAALARKAEGLLLGPETRYVLVAAPTRSAEDDARHLATKLSTLGQRPVGIVLNRADPELPAWTKELERYDVPLALREAVAHVGAELAARGRAAEKAAAALNRRLPGVPCIRFPTVETRDPARIVRTLADRWAVELDTLGGRPLGAPARLAP